VESSKGKRERERERMDAAWACAVGRAVDMADSAKRFFLSFRRPPQQQQPPPLHPGHNPVSELTLLAIQVDIVVVVYCLVFVLPGMRISAGFNYECI
jgi:hypothetical protein